MQIRLIHNQGAGSNTTWEVPEGSTVRDVFSRYGVTYRPDAHILTVNQIAASVDQILSNGDTVSVMANKVGGGRC